MAVYVHLLQATKFLFASIISWLQLLLLSLLIIRQAVMRLIEINKARYRRHLNVVIAACIIGLAAGSLLLSQLLITLFPDDSGSHFHWNLLGVVATSGTIAWLLNKFRHHHFMTEVVYVWELKQALNKITRKMRKLQAEAEKGNINALLALQFSYSGSRQLWQLDDNTIIMEELAVQQAKLDNLAAKYNVVLNTDDYDDNMLKPF